MIDGEKERPFLVCGNRWIRGTKTSESKADSAQSFDFIAHAIAIELTGGKRTICGIRDDSHAWHRKPVEDFGLSSRTAQAALDQAFRLCDVTLDWRTKDIEVTYHPTRATYKNKSAIWKMIALIEWQHWTKNKRTTPDRVKVLHSLGFVTVTPKALTKMAETYGL